MGESILQGKERDSADKDNSLVFDLQIILLTPTNRKMCFFFFLSFFVCLFFWINKKVL
jgi:hypothetical protein